jgi:hypothetical protein
LLADEQQVSEVSVTAGGVLAIAFVKGAGLVCDVVKDGVEAHVGPVNGPGHIDGWPKGACFRSACEMAGYGDVHFDCVDLRGA